MGRVRTAVDTAELVLDAPPGGEARERQLTTDAIVDFIFDEASINQVETIMAALGSRIAELASSRKER